MKGEIKPTLQLYAFTDKGSLDATAIASSDTSGHTGYQLTGADTNAIILSMYPVGSTQRVEFDWTVYVYVQNGGRNCITIPFTFLGVFTTSC